MSDSGRDAAPRTPETNQNTFWRIGGVFLISVAACFSILAFRVIFNCIFIDFCCMRDFSLLRRMRYWLRRMFCLSADPDDLVPNGSRGRNTRPFNVPSMTSRARKDLVKKHLVTGIIIPANILEWKNKRNADKDNPIYNDDTVECAICLSEMLPAEEYGHSRFCTHVFHKDCIITWTDKQFSCPVCRKSLIDGSGT